MRKGKLLGIFAISAVLLTGCVDVMPELTDEQSDMISEYAAGLLLKYSPNYNYKIVDDSIVAAAMEAENTTEEESIEEEALEDGTESQPSQNENSETAFLPGESEQTSEVTIVADDIEADIAQVLDIEGVSIKYQSYGLYDSYPEDIAGFSVDAAQGKKLLVVRFDIEGITGEDFYCDLFTYSLKIRFQINGRSTSALSTLLPNEIGSYMETIPAGETREIVAVAEISDISDEEIETLTMQISDSFGSCNLQMK